MHRVFLFSLYYFTQKVQWPAKKVSHHLCVSVIKALITHLDFDVTNRMSNFSGRPTLKNETYPPRDFFFSANIIQEVVIFLF
jgi:hypothetical protein